MSQHDFDVATADANTGVTVRAQLNAALQALASNSSGGSAPGTPYPCQWWADTTEGVLKIRNEANDDWITMGPISDLTSLAQILTAQGDMIYASAPNTPARLSKGLPGQVVKMNEDGTLPIWGAAGPTIPCGGILAWPTDTPPSGYLECNGASLLRDDYPDLFNVISDCYGAADEDHFNLPDYRGMFLRGWSDGQTTDPGKATRTNRGDGTTGDHVGTKQAAEVIAHTHGEEAAHTHGSGGAHTHTGNTSLYDIAPEGTSSTADRIVRTDLRAPGAIGITINSGGAHSHDAAGAHTHDSVGGDETRPVNINVMWIIRYQATVVGGEGILDIPSATAAGDFIVAEGSPLAWVKKTIAQVKALLHGDPGAIGETAAGSIRGLNKEVVMAATDTLDAIEGAGVIVNNYGQDSDATITLPEAAEGLSLAVILGTTVAKYYRLKAATGDCIYLSGVAGGDGEYVGIASAVAGAMITFVAFKTGASSYDWFATTVQGAWEAE